MKLETLEDVLAIDTDKLKAQENKRLLTRIKQLLKSDKKEETKADENAADYPYTAVSVVGNKYVKIKFDLESKKARVVDVQTDGRDTRGRNHMVGFKAINELEGLVNKQKEK